MKTMLTGLKPTGHLTLGNYIGAISQMVKYQDLYDSYLFVADLHAITVPNNSEELHNNIKEFLALYIACGIDPNKNTIYLQSDIEYLPCISWILECNSYYGELSRMIQFKEKSKGKDNFSCGLLTYPVLMASDILAVDSDIVPVGIDQKQHVELTRDIAIRFNNKYGKTFNIPKPLISTSGTKINDLVNPTKKMSKTEENPKGVIGLLDDEETVTKKIMSATTDSDCLVKYDPDNKPGISNLINICVSLTDDSISDIEKKFKDSNYGEFKRYVASVINETLAKIQRRYYELLNSDEIDKILNDGANKVREKTFAKYQELRKKMGLYR